MEEVMTEVKESERRVKEMRAEKKVGRQAVTTDQEVEAQRSSDIVGKQAPVPTPDDPDPEPDLDQILAAILTSPSDISPLPITIEDKPRTWEEAKRGPDAEKWESRYKDELKSLKEMGVYKLIPRSQVPQGYKVRKGQPVFKIKCDEHRNPVRYKVRLVFKGYKQIYRRDYYKTTSPTARMESWHILLHIAATEGCDTTQINVKTAFLYGILPDNKVQYMEQPEGFEEPGKEDWVCKLVQRLYGMKQVGCIWN